MPRHTDIELTSRSADGHWTWRAAGARQPRGTVPGGIVPEGASVGDVLRAEVESGIDGIDIVALTPLKTAQPEGQRGQRIEVIGSTRRGPDVSVTLAAGSRRRRDLDERPGRGEERGGRPPGRPGGRRPEEGRGERPGRRRERAQEGAGERPERAGRPERRGPGEAEGGRPGRAPLRREPRAITSTAHRNSMLATLRPEQLPVAEQLLRGGIPAVRQAIEEQNSRARAEGRPPVAAEPLLGIAEELLPRVNLAAWKDRATAAQAGGRDVRLRELRAVVVASRNVGLDDEGRAMAKALQQSLDQRVTALREEWETRIGRALDADRVLDALRVSARPPEVSTRCPAELAVRMAEAASAAMSAEQDAELWLALLDAVVDSPVRRTVKPAGIPDNPDVQAAARNAAGLVPELAKLLGLRIPPPPPRRTVVRRGSLTRTSGGGPEASS